MKKVLVLVLVMSTMALQGCFDDSKCTITDDGKLTCEGEALTHTKKVCALLSNIVKADEAKVETSE